MVMFSKIIKSTLIDEKGNRAMLSDLVIELEGNDYPPVTDLIFRDARRQTVRLSWDAVTALDFDNKQIKVNDLNAAEPVTDEAMTSDVLLHRDVLDALILNLERRHATRANDLWLEEEDGKLSLKAADTSAGAVLRRLSLGLFGGKPTSSLYDWKYVEFLRGDPLGVKHGAAYHMRIQLLPPGEIAALSNSLPYLHAAELLTLLPDPIAADTLELMQIERQIQIFGVLEEEQAMRLLALMAPDAAVDLLGRQEPDAMKSYLERLPKERSDLLIELLRYPDDTVGGIMTNDMVSIPMDTHNRGSPQSAARSFKGTGFHIFYLRHRKRQNSSSARSDKSA